MCSVLGAALRGMFSSVPLPPKLPFTFTQLRALPGRPDYEHMIAKHAIASLKSLSGGDLKGLTDFLQEKYSDDFDIPLASPSPVAARVVSALCSVQTHFSDFIDAQKNLDLEPDDDPFLFKENEKVRKINVANAKLSLRVVNAVFVSSDLSYEKCKLLGSNVARSSFIKLKRDLLTHSLSLLSSPPKTGRLSLVRTHSNVIDELSTPLHSPEISTPYASVSRTCGFCANQDSCTRGGGGGGGGHPQEYNKTI